MATIQLTKIQGGFLVPIDITSEQALERVKTGGVIECEFTNKRNPAFLCKFFALLRVGFDLWEPADWHVSTETGNKFEWGTPEKNFEKYRSDVTITAGYYNTVFNLRGEPQVTAKSIAFGSMSEEDFAHLYNNVINVILRHVPATYGAADINEAVDRVIQFS